MKVFFESSKQSLLVELTASNIEFFQRVVSHQVAQADEKPKKNTDENAHRIAWVPNKSAYRVRYKVDGKVKQKMFQAGEDKEQALQTAIAFRDNNP